ncbi:MAG TPA: hypothetical protein VKA19_07845 [Alphaproteobacteria bacterium]|nr:hypothetical protein [Alphaproteobacteria bacterium]
MKLVESGWSWSLFFGATFLGLPLFFRGLTRWGVIMFTVWAVGIALPFIDHSTTDLAVLQWIMSAVVFGLCVYLGFKGNELSAQHYMTCGYERADTRDLEDRVSSRLWDDGAA